ncbi:MAG: hypothetical protein WC421_04915 [Elusimicrobiales bacterium]
MTKNGRILCLLMLAAGLAAGLLAGAARAEDPALMSDGDIRAIWDEHWTALEAYASSVADGVQKLDMSSGTPATKEAAKITGSSVSVHPRMIVTRWKIHGHIHFRQ